MVSKARRHAFRMWATLVYWTGKVTGVLVADTAVEASSGRLEFTAAAVTGDSGGGGGCPPRWVVTRVWNSVCLAAVMHRIGVETWPVTLRAARLTEASCYDTVCGGVWCVYACVYYAVGWLDRASEVCALAAAVTWRRRSTVRCLNSAAAVCCSDRDHENDDVENRWPSAVDVPWHAYLTAAFPAVQLVVAATAISPKRDGAWRSAAAAVAAVASCAPVASHSTAAALLVVANNSMRSINSRVTALLSSHGGHNGRDLRAAVSRLAQRHWWTTELVTGGVCGAYGMDLMAAAVMAAVRVTYVAISVFHRLTDDTNTEENARTNMSPAVVVQLFAWFGQFAYLAYTCDELAAQSSDLFDNLNSLLLDIFKQSRISGETYSSKMQEIEAVQEFMRQVVARKVTVHACGGLITLNLSLITTIIGITLTYFIVLLQFESSHGSSVHNNTITTQ